MSTYSLQAYSLGLVAFMLIKVLAPGFYARQDMKTPVKIGIIAMASNMVLNLLFVLPLYFIWNIGHVGLALATSASAFLNMGLLWHGLVKKGVYRCILKSTADEYGITTMSDLSEYASDFRFGANHLFFTRITDGFDGMNELYDYEFGTVLKMDTSLAYEAIGSDQLDVIVVYATDSLLQRYDMVVLEDDLEFFPAYHGAPLVRTSLLEEYPELNDVLNLMADSIDDAYMQAINYQVDVEDRSISDVASEMIDDLGLLE